MFYLNSVYYYVLIVGNVVDVDSTAVQLCIGYNSVFGFIRRCSVFVVGIVSSSFKGGEICMYGNLDRFMMREFWVCLCFGCV